MGAVGEPWVEAEWLARPRTLGHSGAALAPCSAGGPLRTEARPAWAPAGSTSCCGGLAVAALLMRSQCGGGAGALWGAGFLCPREWFSSLICAADTLTGVFLVLL